MAYLQFKYADSEPAITTSKHHDAQGLEYQCGAILADTSFIYIATTVYDISTTVYDI